MRIRTTAVAALAATAGLALPATSLARHGADDPAGHERHHAGATHHHTGGHHRGKNHRRHHGEHRAQHHRAGDAHGRRHGGRGADD